MGKRQRKLERNLQKGAYNKKMSDEEAKEKREAIWTIFKILGAGVFLGSICTFVLMMLYAGGSYCI